MAVLVTDYLEKTADRFSDKPAFVDETRSITFGTLRRESYCVAMELIRRQFFRKPIVIFMDKSVACIGAFMGVAYSGNYYTPVDVKMPMQRIKKIVETLNPSAIITDEKNEESAKQIANQIPVILYEATMLNSVVKEQIEERRSKITDADVLYVLFTSGSTGIPKGVVVPHKGVITYTEWCSEEFEITESDILGNQTPFYFSMSVLDIFQTLKNGATTYIIPHIYFSFPIKLLHYIAEHKINMLYWVPSALCLVANLKALGRVDISCVKKILFAGEVMPTKQLNMWRRALPNALFANLFGPTEVTDICTFYKLGRTLQDDEAVPIGRNCHNSGIVILNEENDSAAAGEIGELCVYGSTLAYGYYNNPEKTKAVFVQNPLNELYPEIIYRTGDLVRYNQYQELVYMGRKDFQIKHMGHRIELGEIETAVSALPHIDRCCCVYDTGQGRIVLFFTGEVDEESLARQLRENLPEYMLPNRKIRMGQMPINLNGKIDRQHLQMLLQKGEEN